MMNFKKASLVSIACISLSPLCPLSASLVQSGELKGNFGIRASTLGAGLDFSTLLNEHVNLRFQINGLQYKRHFNSDTMHYHTNLKMLSMGPILEYHPCTRGFFGAIGFFYNGNKMLMDGTPQHDVVFNGVRYTPTQVGKISARTKFSPFAPYVGVGYDSSFESANPLSVGIDLGVLFQGKSKNRVSATGTLANDGTFLANLHEDVKSVTRKNVVKYFPVVGISLRYRF